MAKNTGKKIDPAYIPKDVHEAANTLAQIVEHQRKINSRTAKANRKMDLVKSQLSQENTPDHEEIAEHIKGLFVFAQKNHKRLTEDGKRKSVKLPTGLFGWRTNPPYVWVGNAKEVLKRLKAKKLWHLIRTTYEINKEAILDDPGAIKNIKQLDVKQKETFYVKPDQLNSEFETNLIELPKIPRS